MIEMMMMMYMKEHKGGKNCGQEHHL